MAGAALNYVNAASSRCLDVSGVSQAQGAQIHMWDCHTQRQPALDQNRPPSELRVYGNRCLDVNGNGTADGTKIQIWECNGTTAQKFTQNSAGALVGTGSGKCLHATGNDQRRPRRATHLQRLDGPAMDHPMTDETPGPVLRVTNGHLTPA